MGNLSGAASGGFEDGFERQLGDGCDVGEAPVLVLERWETEFGKTRDAGLAQREQPRGLAACADLLEAFEGFQVRLGLFRWGSWLGDEHREQNQCIEERPALTPALIPRRGSAKTVAVGLASVSATDCATEVAD